MVIALVRKVAPSTTSTARAKRHVPLPRATCSRKLDQLTLTASACNAWTRVHAAFTCWVRMRKRSCVDSIAVKIAQTNAAGRRKERPSCEWSSSGKLHALTSAAAEKQRPRRSEGRITSAGARGGHVAKKSVAHRTQNERPNVRRITRWRLTAWVVEAVSIGSLAVGAPSCTPTPSAAPSTSWVTATLGGTTPVTSDSTLIWLRAEAVRAQPRTSGQRARTPAATSDMPPGG